MSKTPTRIYAVTNTTTGAVGLVRAATPAQAVRYVTRTLFAAEVASQDAIVSAMSRGVAVVDASGAPGDAEGEQAEKCESGDPACGPVVTHDSEGTPLCQRCADELASEGA